MHRSPFFRLSLVVTVTLAALACVTSAAAATFRTREGQTIEGEITGLYADLLVISIKTGSFRQTLDHLDDASLQHVAAFLERPAVPAPRWRDSTSKLGKGLTKRLRVLREGKLVDFNPGDRPEPEFYLVCFGAYWCGPCRRFSPTLVQTYQQLKQKDPDRFEVIFVSDDRDASGQLDYAREVAMPFPMLRFGSNVAAFDQWRGNGIPCLVVLNRHGDLVFHSYSGEKYLGARDPLERFAALHEHLSAGKDLPSPGRHRLAVARHLRAAAGGDRAAAPYLVTIDPRKNRTLPKGQVVQALLEIDARGRVTEAEFPALEMIAAHQLQAEAKDWLFLPAIRNGKAEPATIEVPLRVAN